jgi:hypothetical protein
LTLSGTMPINLSMATTASEVLASSPHSILIESPVNNTNYESLMPLNFTVNYLDPDPSLSIAWQRLTSLNYSIDGGSPVMLAERDRINTVVFVSSLSTGLHKVEVTASFVGNLDNLFLGYYTFSSEPVYFTVHMPVPVVDTSPPNVSVLSPLSGTYLPSEVRLNLTVDESVSWVGYLLDGGENVTVTGNLTLPELSVGQHMLRVYANDTAGNVGVSEIVTFSIAEPEKETFPTVPVAVASGTSIAAVVAGILLYVRKLRRGQTT